MNLILASTSPYRRALLGRLRVDFQTIDPEVNEDNFKDSIADPHLLATTLAKAKASAVRDRYPTHVVIGSDQVATLDQNILGKPGTAVKAIEQLQMLSGRKHSLLTAVTILGPTIDESFIDITDLTFRKLTQSEIERYVESDSPLDCAGSYKIERLGPSLLESVRTFDPTAIEGLPLIKTSSLLRKIGFQIP